MLAELGLNEYQVTIDGPADTHDTLRVLRGGGPTFARVHGNVVALLRGNPRAVVALRVNFNHGNLETIPRLLETFPRDIRARLHPVYEPIFGDCRVSATANIPPAEISAALATHYQLARELGFGVRPQRPAAGKLVYCYAERENQVIVGPDGNVFKCAVGQFPAEDRVGFIGDDGVLVRESAWNDWVGTDVFPEQCVACSYLPLCMGGCRKIRLQRANPRGECTLVPTNVSYVLKQVALGRFADTVQAAVPGPD